MECNKFLFASIVRLFVKRRMIIPILLQLVYKVKSNHLVDCLSKSDNEELYLPQLMQCLENIQVQTYGGNPL